MHYSVEEATALVATFRHWHHDFEIFPGVWTKGNYNPLELLRKINFPDDLTGQSVLDIGASDGYFSLEAKKRGARVLSIDYRPKDGHGFGIMETLSGFQFDYLHANLFDLKPEDLGQFDHVIFMGLLYHLPDMMRGFAMVRTLSKRLMYLETHCSPSLSPEVAAARYYRARDLNNDLTNFWSPNVKCVADMAHDCAFDLVEGAPFGDRYFGTFRVNNEPERQEKMRLAYGLL